MVRRMLRPYVAVIKDAFREAIASRVLWILLSLVTWLLIALALIGYREWEVTSLRPGDIDNWRVLVRRLAAAENGTADATVQRIWSSLEVTAQERVRELAASLQNRPDMALKSDQRSGLLSALNAVIQLPDFDDKKSWDDSRLTEEVLRLCDQPVDSLSPQQLRRRNRLLVEAALPQLVRRSPVDMVEFTWFFWKIPKVVPMSRERLRDSIDLGLSGIMRYVVGIVAVFVAILVTAPIVPQTFTSGSLNLLLSKPLSRSLLFLAKYVGGCAFVLLVSGYMILGLWLIAGLRFGVWHPELLYAIPIFAFLFAVYYSVSSFAGVIWKNAIVSIVLTILLWSILVVVAITKMTVDSFYIKPFRLIRMITAKDTLIAMNELGLTYAWNDSQKSWQPIFESDEVQSLAAQANAGPGMLGPVFHVAGDQLVAVPQGQGDVSALGISPRLAVGRRADDWQRTTSVAVPSGVKALRLGVGGEVLLISTNGVFRITGELRQDIAQPTIFGVELPIEQRGPFVSLGPPQPLDLMGDKMAIAVNQDDGRIAIYDHAQMTILRLGEDGQYDVAHTYSLGTSHDRLLLAFAGNTLCVANADGNLEILDPATGGLRHASRPESHNQPRFISAAPGGRWFAVVFQHGRMVVIDAQQGTTVPQVFTGQGDVSAAKFNQEGKLLVAERTNRVTTYDLYSMRATKVCAPPLDLLERSYRYAISPLYWMLPKPAELNDTIYYLLTRRESAGISGDLFAPHEAFDPWTPVWSSLVFVAVVLAVACIYLERSEF